MTAGNQAVAKIALASDHAGYPLKEELKAYVRDLGHEVQDLGTHGLDSVDYPDYGAAMGDALVAGEASTGILVCGTGIGISIAANRNPAIRAALCHDGLTARMAREHNDANVLALGGRVIGIETAKECVSVFLTTEFEGGRHARRVAKLDTSGN